MNGDTPLSKRERALHTILIRVRSSLTLPLDEMNHIYEVDGDPSFACAEFMCSACGLAALSYCPIIRIGDQVQYYIDEGNDIAARVKVLQIIEILEGELR